MFHLTTWSCKVTCKHTCYYLKQTKQKKPNECFKKFDVAVSAGAALVEVLITLFITAAVKLCRSCCCAHTRKSNYWLLIDEVEPSTAVQHTTGREEKKKKRIDAETQSGGTNEATVEMYISGWTVHDSADLRTFSRTSPDLRVVGILYITHRFLRDELRIRRTTEMLIVQFPFHLF